MVTLGGADPDNVTLKVVRALLQTGLDDLEVNIVAGPANPSVKMLESEIENARQLGRTVNFSMRLIIDANMPELMAWADVALSAGGSTCWELAFMGVPFLVLILADNQERIALGLEKKQIALNCGWFHTLSAEDIAERLEWLIDDSERRAEYSARGQYLVDGLGAERIVKCLMEL